MSRLAHGTEKLLLVFSSMAVRAWNSCKSTHGPTLECLGIAFPDPSRAAKVTSPVLRVQRCSHQKTKPKAAQLGKCKLREAKLDCAEIQEETDAGGTSVSGPQLPAPQL